MVVVVLVIHSVSFGGDGHIMGGVEVVIMLVVTWW